MNAQQNAPISDRFSSLCARVFSPAAAILKSEKTLGTRLETTGSGEENDDVSTLEVVYTLALPDVALFRASS